MQDFWQSNVEVSGTLLECSTSFQILSSSSLKDREKELRFNPNKSLKQHQFQFKVWQKSMFLRYALESTFFLLIALAFQYLVAIFNSDVHKIREDKLALA